VLKLVAVTELRVELEDTEVEDDEDAVVKVKLWVDERLKELAVDVYVAVKLVTTVSVVTVEVVL
jgi:hypothetical protein